MLDLRPLVVAGEQYCLGREAASWETFQGET